LDDVHVLDALKDESPALLHELQRLEYKMNILLKLIAELSVRYSAVPPAHRVKISARAVEWFTEQVPPVGETGLLWLYINPALAQPLKIPSGAKTICAWRKSASRGSAMRWWSCWRSSFFAITGG
jgi:hypothetical protein